MKIGDMKQALVVHRLVGDDLRAIRQGTQDATEAYEADDLEQVLVELCELEMLITKAKGRFDR
jgi:hypothetical protein